MTYYKAIRPNGTDFYTGTVQWVLESGVPANGFVVNHPTSTEWEVGHETHLCASTSPTDCTGFEWPCRLLEVEPESEVHEHDGNKVSALTWRVVRELPATQALGPQGEAVAALIEGLGRLDAEALARLVDAAQCVARNAAQRTARDAARIAAQHAAQRAARYSARIAAQVATRDTAQRTARYSARIAAQHAAQRAAVALIVWDLITPDQRDILTEPIRTALPDLWADVIKHLPHN